MGKTPERKEINYWNNGKYNWVSISDMINKGYINNTKEKVSESAKNNVYKKIEISKRGTLLMSFKLTIGKISILNIDAYHNEAIISIYPKNDKDNIVRNFLFNFLPIITDHGNKKDAVKGRTLNSESLNNLSIPFPPLAEQQAIVSKLDVLMPLCKTIDTLLK
jgi:type I restriction enzyme S subunit